MLFFGKRIFFFLYKFFNETNHHGKIEMCVCVGVKYTKKKYIDMGPHILHGWVTLVISTLSLKNKYWCEFWKKSQVQPTIIIHVNVIYKNFFLLQDIIIIMIIIMMPNVFFLPLILSKQNDYDDNNKKKWA